MSLLLEALKKAEKAKRSNTPDASVRAPEPKSNQGLELEMPAFKQDELRPPSLETHGGNEALPTLDASEVEPPAPRHEQSFPEISLAEMKISEPTQPTSPAAPGEFAPAQAIAPDVLNTERVEFAPLDFSASEPETQRHMPPDEHIAMTSETPSPTPAVEIKIEPGLSLDFPEPPPKASEPPTAPEPPVAAQRVEIPQQPPAAPEKIVTAEPATAPQLAQTPPPAIPETAAETAKKQDAAKQILAAKQGKPKRNLKLLGGFLIVSTLAGAAGAYYFWQTLAQLDTAPPPVLQIPAPVTTQPPAATPADADSGTPPAAPQEPAAVPQADKEASSLSPSTAPQEAASTEKPSTQKKPTAKPARTSQHPDSLPEPAPARKMPSGQTDKVSIKEPASTSAPESGIKFRRDADDTRLDPLLASAYQAFMAGDTGRAENDYRKALQQTPNNRDALLGLAAVAAKRGQAQEAATHYLRVLQLDPRDAAAQAGLIGLRGYADPTLSESRLKTLLAQQPDAGYLHFALGNLYAYQARWPEAQEAYFNALHGDAGNADYAFNLAVSLDHLDQRKPALVYYQRALTLVKERSASFDSEQLKKRIHELQGN